MPDLTELDAKVREAVERIKGVKHDIGLAPRTYYLAEQSDLDALISAVRTHERARCRQAVEGEAEKMKYEMGEYVSGYEHAIKDATDAIDALETP